jgi:uncharacterized protein YprB with RNaseH-like and TPR domain
MSLADRLRGVMGVGIGRPAADGGPPEDPPYDAHGASVRAVRPHESAADVLGGEWREARGQRFLVVDRKYGPGHRHGRVAIADGLPPSSGLWPRLSLLAGADCGSNLLFIDLETTGLAGGAGTYAFLVGCAWFDSTCLRVRQFFLANFAAERALLDAVCEVADDAGTVVTYNGKTFDLPLMETRFVMNRMETPFAGMPHIDMLHPARRLWRDDDEAASCRLSTLEQTLCGHEREGDVPGFEIPSRYFHYVRTGNAGPLAAVLEHNRLDLLSLALLTARAAQLLDEGPAAVATAREALGLGKLYERAELYDLARDCYARSADLAAAYRQGTGRDAVRAEALRAYALLSRRQRRYADAADAWQRILELRWSPPAFTREAAEALAIHHEHRLRDPHAARAFALQSLQLPATPARRASVHHRLARLGRKLGSDAEPAIPF